ncbi:MAG: peptidylprolyl isomerase [Alphaproteobacteria bacterium]|jgi:FKBP-type peptidyl-prolyl cis-trans isomerase SlyD|nr:peptidylprolyl isomerase [Alphaproteobacteria bacterium]MBT4084888.1 peptidylprolyl isomerase [Alphaproteobacteria bacterium]MBT4544079.1 peptidylprolyl isomerase [Alphaproteobacteria bacterium]MBT7744463.1 peptidylprolyl isomerase [Alphaproteobacteria bacterium]
MKDTIQNNKYVELKYKVVDEKTGTVLVGVDFPIGYIHGANDILAPAIMEELEGKIVGEVISVPFDGDQIYGPRDESLVYTDSIGNVPEEYRELGATILTENEKGEQRSFIVTRVDDKTLTVDGNNPLSGRKVVFNLDVLTIRDATAEEIDAGGPINVEPEIGNYSKVPI